MPIIWNNSYSVGLEEIDSQHKQLIVLMNRLELITKFNPTSENYADKFMNVLNELTNYTILHFATEEVLMKMFDYPDFDNHKLVHEKFVNLIKEKKHDLEMFIQVEQDLNKKNEFISAMATELFDFLQKWLINHIMKTDKVYTEFFIKIKNKAKKSGGWLSFLK